MENQKKSTLTFAWAAFSPSSADKELPFMDRAVIQNGIEHHFEQKKQYSLEAIASAGLVPYSKVPGGIIYREGEKTGINYWFKDKPYE